MREVFALDPDVRAPTLTQARRRRQRSRATNPLAQFTLVICLETGVVQMLPDPDLESFERRHQRFGNIAPAKRPEAATFVRQVTIDRRLQQLLSFAGL
jgi:hypothetical protein